VYAESQVLLAALLCEFDVAAVEAGAYTRPLFGSTLSASVG